MLETRLAKETEDTRQVVELNNLVSSLQAKLNKMERTKELQQRELGLLQVEHKEQLGEARRAVDEANTRAREERRRREKAEKERDGANSRVKDLKRFIFNR